MLNITLIKLDYTRQSTLSYRYDMKMCIIFELSAKISIVMLCINTKKEEKKEEKSLKILPDKYLISDLLLLCTPTNLRYRY